MIDERPLISGVGIVPEKKYFCTDFAREEKYYYLF